MLEQENDCYLIDKSRIMRKVMSILAFFMLLSSCKEEVVEKPQRFIEKGVMVDIMYDLSILEAIKYQNPNSVEDYKVKPSDFIFKKYKVDSTQFAQNNVYYASNYHEYEAMYEQVLQRIDKQKVVVDSLIKSEDKKKQKIKKAKIVKDTLTVKDSLKRKEKSFRKHNLIKEASIKKEALQ